MLEPLSITLTIAALALAAVVVGYVVIDRRPDRTLLAALTLLEAGLVAQCGIGIWQLVGDSVEVSAVTFVGYLIGALVVVPLTAVWAVGEPTRSGTAVLVVGLLVVPVLVLRLEQIWDAGG
ncbi:hypothetical protein [Nocardioides speluncae]|uniref:hypothetical protein n=1 Tax=Nocardioides speluncae TaxID=2670337 RepID=UPI000D686131|nr:hypothetical protein [Nocardioides speluncae]